MLRLNAVKTSQLASQHSFLRASSDPPADSHAVFIGLDAHTVEAIRLQRTHRAQPEDADAFDQAQMVSPIRVRAISFFTAVLLLLSCAFTKLV